ncbi:hypothetical protein AAFC00_006625 [Neodothiora populina]|uniref:Uncharacterized protein n=1 Tax=Neodothiora populina TaxID=2781224 RepID=A0ABR3PBS5_9PEZI
MLTTRPPITQDQDVVQMIKNRLNDEAKGMFLWVRLQVETIWETCTTDAQILTALKHLPPTLEETYSRCLERLHASRRPYAFKVLRYVYTVYAPFSLVELSESFAVDPDLEDSRAT